MHGGDSNGGETRGDCGIESDAEILRRGSGEQHLAGWPANGHQAGHQAGHRTGREGLLRFERRLPLRLLMNGTARPMHRRALVIRAFFALWLLAATFNHARAIAAHGLLWDYGYGSDIVFVSKLFWAALTLLDPLAALLLFVRPRAGLALTVAIIVCDVLHNGWYVARHGQWLATFFVSQLAFCVAVLALTPLTPLAARPFRSRGPSAALKSDVPKSRATARQG
ncbi:hypothetical protein [Paraburkholderia sp. WP4_3_2]|uniref:hypothetical protein n=1 Tax=Paraburkholderia sp. WP4_3_2 TaxID=2587162 RepID=UPI001C870D9C|nr:hypothetical protein [Paraburkholderia sp. WP4_3_2]